MSTPAFSISPALIEEIRDFKTSRNFYYVALKLTDGANDLYSLHKVTKQGEVVYSYFTPNQFETYP